MKLSSTTLIHEFEAVGPQQTTVHQIRNTSLGTFLFIWPDADTSSDPEYWFPLYQYQVIASKTDDFGKVAFTIDNGENFREIHEATVMNSDGRMAKQWVANENTLIDLFYTQEQPFGLGSQIYITPAISSPF